MSLPWISKFLENMLRAAEKTANLCIWDPNLKELDLASHSQQMAGMESQHGGCATPQVVNASTLNQMLTFRPSEVGRSSTQKPSWISPWKVDQVRSLQMSQRPSVKRRTEICSRASIRFASCA